ncbi:sugar transferase [Leuconostoc lactis]|uniref:sugar transferase n=1 Tax=Leuconostoc lactis TaxID=1246 RepID=UPI0025B080A7|nr:sugar transferase [Leuconostoc lactis]MDN2649364.1 sugar transferase [Leuconostoc lactis]
MKVFTHRSEKNKRVVVKQDVLSQSEHFGGEKIPYKPFTIMEIFLKRTIDIIGGSVGTVLFLAAVVILFFPYYFSNEKDKGPILYKQPRYGKNGKIFYILKFRTMIVDADDYLEKHPEIKLKYLENGNKLRNDPRVTKIGKFIRSKSIDELPQFLNVLKGEMSLVGPRPILLFEKKEYGKRLKYLLLCKPGITGYWTTHGRSKILYPKRAELELTYLTFHSTLNDLKLIILTIYQAMKGMDAY